MKRVKLIALLILFTLSFNSFAAGGNTLFRLIVRGGGTYLDYMADTFGVTISKALKKHPFAGFNSNNMLIRKGLLLKSGNRGNNPSFEVFEESFANLGKNLRGVEAVEFKRANELLNKEALYLSKSDIAEAHDLFYKIIGDHLYVKGLDLTACDTCLTDQYAKLGFKRSIRGTKNKIFSKAMEVSGIRFYDKNLMYTDTRKAYNSLHKQVTSEKYRRTLQPISLDEFNSNENKKYIKPLGKLLSLFKGGKEAKKLGNILTELSVSPSGSGNKFDLFKMSKITSYLANLDVRFEKDRKLMDGMTSILETMKEKMFTKTKKRKEGVTLRQAYEESLDEYCKGAKSCDAAVRELKRKENKCFF